MTARLHLDDLVELGGGWVRPQEPGEELFRLVVFGQPTRWMPEALMLSAAIRYDAIAPGIKIESMVVEGIAPDAPDPRQMDLPL